MLDWWRADMKSVLVPIPSLHIRTVTTHYHYSEIMWNVERLSFFLLVWVEYHCGSMAIVKADLPGYDLSSQYTSNFSMCCSWCQSYLGCQAFTWVSAPSMYYGMCYLKWSSGGGPNPFTSHISAYYWAHTTIESIAEAMDYSLKTKISSLYSSVIVI